MRGDDPNVYVPNWHIVVVVVLSILAWGLIYRGFVLLIRAFDAWGWLAVN